MNNAGVTRNSTNRFYRRAAALTIAAIIIYAIAFSVYLFTREGWTYRIVVVLVGCAIASFVIFLFRYARGFLDPAFAVPFFIYLIYLAGSCINGHFPSFFPVFFCICGVAMMYFNYWKFMLFAVLANTITLILILSGVFTTLGPGYTFAELLLNWIFSVFGSFFMLSAVQVVTERIASSTMAKDSFTTMLSSTPDYIVLVDKLNYVTFISRSMAEFAHIEDPKMALGRPLLDIFRDIDIKLKVTEILDSQGLYEGTWELSLNGESRYFRILSNRLLGDTTGLFISLSDITPLVKARFDAEAADRAKSTFLANTSHEIRTPMNAILGMAEIILRKNIAPDVREDAMHIRQAGTNLLTIINDVLDFSKIESGKLDIVPVEYRFDSLIDDVINVTRMRLIEKRLDFITKIDGSLPLVLIGDEIRVRQVLLNLLSNAVKYTKEGDICLSIFSCGPVAGEETPDSVVLTFEVSDSGIGIRPENVTQLFGEFEQFDTRINRGLEGTGLGLAISRNLCRLMGGDITAQSVYGKGSVFSAVIPQEVKDPAPFAPVSDPQTKATLICDDKEKRAQALTYTVSRLGVPCSLASNREELLSLLQEGRYRYALVSSSMYDEVRTMLEAADPPLVLAVLPDIRESGGTFDCRVLPMPVQPISLAHFFNGKTETADKPVHDISPVHFTVPDALFLVVDDIATNLKVADAFLSPYQAVVDTCLSGAKAIELAQRHRYDIIFMDHMMPGMDGVEATAQIRAWEAEQLQGEQFPGARTPIVALTANAVSGMREMFLEKGFDDFLSKPIEVIKLDEIIRKWVSDEKKIAIKDQGPDSQSPIPDSRFLFSIPGVDVTKGIAMTGGTLAMYKKVLALFHRDVQERLALLRQLPDEGSLPVFTTQVHAIKGASASLGASELSAEAARLEAAGKAGDMALIRQALPGFASRLEKLAAGIVTALERTPAEETKASVAAPFDTVLLSLVRDLKNALVIQKSDIIDRIMGELNQHTGDPAILKTLETISDHVLIADFTKAIATIDEFLDNNG